MYGNKSNDAVRRTWLVNVENSRGRSLNQIQEMTSLEVVAYAIVGFSERRFTASDLATILCRTLALRLTPGNVAAVRRHLETAVSLSYIDLQPSIRGGDGHCVTKFGVAQAADVELPLDVRDTGVERRLSATGQLP
ncbi:hypothetical protein LP420_04260 [Massilia sp. B-10]|nr:hypothetical protein LP420_04260 [Massilia sp. B-10]